MENEITKKIKYSKQKILASQSQGFATQWPPNRASQLPFHHRERIE